MPSIRSRTDEAGASLCTPSSGQENTVSTYRTAGPWFLVAMIMIAAGRTQAAEWTGLGDGTTWGDANNWDTLDVPDTATEDAVFGNLSPDAAQLITLDADVTIRDLLFSATGNRSYTINDNGGGETLSLRRWNGNTGAGTQTLTQNAKTFYTAPATIMNWGDGNTLVINGGQRIASTTSTIHWQTYDQGKVLLNSDWGENSGGNAQPLASEGTTGTSEIILNHAHAWAEPNETQNSKINASALMSIAADTRVGGLQLHASGTVTLSIRYDGRAHAAAGSQRVLSVEQLINPGNINFVDDAPGSAVNGGVTLLLTSAFSFDHLTDINFGTQADGIVEFAPVAVSDSPPKHTDSFSDISGAGKVVVSGSDTMVHVAGAWSHTGGTDVNAGTLQLGGALVHPSTPQAGVGSLPDTGAVTVNTGAILDLNGNSESIGKLAGSGAVHLGGATLTLTEGVSPGNSMGTLTVSEAGTVVFAAGSVYTFDYDTLDQDLLVLEDATLSAVGPWTLDVGPSFDQSEQTILLANAQVIDASVLSNFAGATGISVGYSLFTESDGQGGANLYLEVVPEPSSMALLVAGGVMAAWRRPKEHA